MHLENTELAVNPTLPRGRGLLSPLEPECAFLSEGPLEADVCPKREGQKASALESSYQGKHPSLFKQGSDPQARLASPLPPDTEDTDQQSISMEVHLAEAPPLKLSAVK